MPDVRKGLHADEVVIFSLGRAREPLLFLAWIKTTILYLVWIEYLPGVTREVSAFQCRLSVGGGRLKIHDTKPLACCC